MNRVTLLGRVGNDPEVKEVGQTKVCKFSLATSESYKKNGEKITETTWHNLIFWGKQCDNLKLYVHKGDQLLVEGKIITRTYVDRNEVTHWTTEIVCDRFEFVGSKKQEYNPENKEGQYQKGKVHTGAMSDPAELDPTFPHNITPEEEPFA